VQNTLEGYIIEFVAENHQYFSKVEVYIQEWSQRKIVVEIYCCGSRSCLVEEGMLPVPLGDMAS
jgi:hypothetical protein